MHVSSWYVPTSCVFAPENLILFIKLRCSRLMVPNSSAHEMISKMYQLTHSIHTGKSKNSIFACGCAKKSTLMGRMKKNCLGLYILYVWLFWNTDFHGCLRSQDNQRLTDSTWLSVHWVWVIIHFVFTIKGGGTISNHSACFRRQPWQSINESNAHVTVHTVQSKQASHSPHHCCPNILLCSYEAEFTLSASSYSFLHGTYISNCVQGCFVHGTSMLVRLHCPG